VVRQEMRSRSGHERRESLEEGQRLEDDRAGAVAPGAPQPVDHAPVRIDREPLAGYGGAGDVPAQPLESGAVVACDRELGVEREALEVAAQLAKRSQTRMPGGVGGAGLIPAPTRFGFSVFIAY